MTKKDTTEITFIAPFSFFEKAIKLKITPNNKSINPMRTIGSIMSSEIQFITSASDPNAIKPIDQILKGFSKLVQPPYSVEFEMVPFRQFTYHFFSFLFHFA